MDGHRRRRCRRCHGHFLMLGIFGCRRGQIGSQSVDVVPLGCGLFVANEDSVRAWRIKK